MMVRQVVLSAILLVLSSSAAQADATMQKEMAALKETVCKQLLAKGCKKVAALDFVDLQGRRNELGRYLSEQLTVEMVGTEGLAVLDRANLKSVLDEHKLTEEGLVKPENAKALGQFSGVDAIIIGNVTMLETEVMLVVKAISTENSEIVAASRCTFAKSPDLQALLTKAIDTDLNAPAAGPAKAGASGIIAAQDAAIATKDIGQLRIALKNVAPLRAQVTNDRNNRNDGKTEMIVGVLCSFDLSNTDLQRPLKVARNSAVKLMGYTQGQIVNLSTLTDSDGHTWRSQSATGIPRVVCGANGDSGSIVKYIQSGENVEGEGSLPGNHLNRSNFKPTDHPTAWAGDFAPIEPAKTSQISMTFRLVDEQGNPGGTKTLDSFRFECQLVVGVVDPATRKVSYTLETIAFDKVTMQIPQSKP